MSSKCKDPNYILTTPECKTGDIDTYNNYISQMNLYCSKSDNIIANPNCIDYINNNKFIQIEDFTKNFKQTAGELCLDNLNPLYDSNCIQSYKTKPLEFIRQEEIQIQLAKDIEAKKVQEKAAAEAKVMYTWIMIGLAIFALLSGSIYLIYKKRNTATEPPIARDNRDVRDRDVRDKRDDS